VLQPAIDPSTEEERGEEARAASFLGQRDLSLLVTAPLYLSCLSTPSWGKTGGDELEAEVEVEEGDDGERQRRGEVGVGRWCEADRDGDGEWECEWNGCRNPIQSNPDSGGFP